MPRKKSIRLLIRLFLCVATSLPLTQTYAQQHVLLKGMHHLRNGGGREWSSFNNDADEQLSVEFSVVEETKHPSTIAITQLDVKQRWRVYINNTPVGTLIQDEKKLTTYFEVPPGILRRDNTLSIRTEDKTPDDISVGDIQWIDGKTEALMTATIDIEVTGEDGLQLPSRITIVNQQRSLQTVLCEPLKNIALRPGCIYMAHPVSVRLPPGEYTIYAGRGFEYGIDSVIVNLKAGDRTYHRFKLQREVATQGWIASDTHVHTFTYSRHGDASTRERVITLAGEGIEMPVATDHNLYVDFSAELDAIRKEHKQVKMSLITGDEVTTKVGHFNVFKVPEGSDMIDHRGETWSQIADALRTVPTRVVILNHARDVHNGFRPFDPTRHLASVGMEADDWIVPANAMEVINSGSQQSDFKQLFFDWQGMLNGGTLLTPIGSSDSHDVNRYIVGQGRTYVKGNDTDPDAINIDEALHNVVNGKVLVSCGLLTNIRVNGAGPGELAKAGDKIKVDLDVLGPAWSNVEVVELYMNGSKVKEASIKHQSGPINEHFSWVVDAPGHDVFFTALAYGRTAELPFWSIAKPYQPTSADWTPHMFAITGAVWVDGDKDGTRQSARGYAERLVKARSSNLKRLIRRLSAYDEATARQAAALLWKDGKDLAAPEVVDALSHAVTPVKRAFHDVQKEITYLKPR